VGTCLSSVTEGRIDLKFYSETAREFGFAASGWSEGVLAGRAKEMKNGKVRLSQEQLSMLIGGIELKQARRKDWYRKEIVGTVAEKSGD
jgi:hypothetical protein